MQNSMMVFTFSVFDWRCPFWANFVLKIKILNLNWNLALRLIQIHRIQWWCSNGVQWWYTFWTNLVQKIFSLSWNLLNFTNSNVQNTMVVFTFSALDRKYPFRANFFQRIKIVRLSWKLVPTLIPTDRIQ